MDRALLLRRRKTAQRPQQARHARLDRLPVLPDALFLKPVLRPELHKRRLRHRAARKTNGVEDLRMIQPQLEKYIIELRPLYCRNLKLIRQGCDSLQNGMIDYLSLLVHLLIIIRFHLVLLPAFPYIRLITHRCQRTVSDNRCL